MIWIFLILLTLYFSCFHRMFRWASAVWGLFFEQSLFAHLQRVDWYFWTHLETDKILDRYLQLPKKNFALVFNFSSKSLLNYYPCIKKLSICWVRMTGSISEKLIIIWRICTKTISHQAWNCSEPRWQPPNHTIQNWFRGWACRSHLELCSIGRFWFIFVLFLREAKCYRLLAATSINLFWVISCDHKTCNRSQVKPIFLKPI